MEYTFVNFSCQENQVVEAGFAISSVSSYQSLDTPWNVTCHTKCRVAEHSFGVDPRDTPERKRRDVTV